MRLLSAALPHHDAGSTPHYGNPDWVWAGWWRLSWYTVHSCPELLTVYVLVTTTGLWQACYSLLQVWVVTCRPVTGLQFFIFYLFLDIGTIFSGDFDSKFLIESNLRKKHRKTTILECKNNDFCYFGPYFYHWSNLTSVWPDLLQACYRSAGRRRVVTCNRYGN